MDDFVGGILITLVGLLLIGLLVTTVAGMSDDLANFELPRCQEDQVLVGEGNFEDGYWEGYVCGPTLDDVTGGG